MNYVEWLRVKGVLRNTAIVLGILIICGIGLRIWLTPYASVDGFISHIQTEPGTTMTKSVLPDGTQRTVIDAPAKRTHVVIDDRGYNGKHITITEPTKNTDGHNEHVRLGSVTVTSSRNGEFTTTDIETNNAVPLLFYMAFADVVALIIAPILGAPFAREYVGHLEIALTKPASRVRLALGIMLTDAGGILLASLMTVVALYICQLMFETPAVDISGLNAQALAMGIALPLTWYAMLCAATASLSRGYATVLGFAWPVALFTLLLGFTSFGNSLLAQAVHNIFWFVSQFNPLAYASFSYGSESAEKISPAQATFAMRYSIELALLALYSIAAILQWRRVEA